MRPALRERQGRTSSSSRAVCFHEGPFLPARCPYRSTLRAEVSEALIEALWILRRRPMLSIETFRTGGRAVPKRQDCMLAVIAFSRADLHMCLGAPQMCIRCLCGCVSLLSARSAIHPMTAEGIACNIMRMGLGPASRVSLTWTMGEVCQEPARHSRGVA